ncbi:MAG: geranylgeranylglycerol-phosphate geranylgeranyltransferase [Bacteroidetes bacterium]|nr:geranylgeranylglycerol-phosphate geranylgeranyltransferase [Bacteroidota bacterium]
MNAKFRALIQIVRPVNLLIILLTQVLFMAKGAGWMDVGLEKFLHSLYTLNPDLLRWTDAGFLILATLSAAAAGNVVNDIEGQAADAVNKPERCVVGTVIRPRTAWIVYGILLALSIGASWMVDMAFFLFTVAVNLLLFFYSSDLKGMPPAGNILVALLTGAVVFVSRKGLEDASVLPFSEFTMMAFLLNLSREWVKDVDDREGDERAGLRTMAVVYGSARTLKLAALTLCLAFGVALALAVFHPGGWMFRLHVALASLGILHQAVTLLRSQTAGPSSQTIKRLMIFGLLAVIWV